MHVIGAFAPYEGMGRVISELAAGVPGEHHVLAARAESVGPPLASITAVGGRPSTYLFTRRRRVRRALATVRPDVVHLHGGTFTPLLARLRSFRAVPKVLSIYNWPRIPGWKDLRRAPVRSLVTSQILPPRVVASTLVPAIGLRRAVAARDVIGVLTPDRSVARRLQMTGKVELVVGGASHDSRRAEFDRAKPIVVFAGRAETVRGLDVLIDAMKLVRRRVPNARLRLVLLRRPDLKRLLRRIADAQMSDAVDLKVGPITDLRAELVDATVGAFPFLFDNVTLTPALTVAEAMSVGLPVVGTPVDCISAAVRSGVNGLLVPVGDVRALADAIATLLTDEEQWQTVAEGAVRTVQTDLDWSSVVDAASRRYAAAAAHSGSGRKRAEANVSLRPKIEPGRVVEIDEHFTDVGASYERIAFPGAGHAFVSGRELDAVRWGLVGLERGSDVLDVGVGTGRVTRVLCSDLGLRVTGMDAIAEMLRATRSGLAGVPLVQSRLGEPLPFGDETFDAVVAIRVLKWVPRWADALKELARVVRPGGYVVFEVTNRRSLAAFGYRGAPVTRLSVDEVRPAATEAGLLVADQWPGTRMPHRLWTFASTQRRAVVLAAIERALDARLGAIGARSIVFVARKPLKGVAQ